MKYLLVIALIFSTLTSCVETNPGADINIKGLKPIYVNLDIEEIRNLPPREFEELQNIVLYKSYIYLVELLVGVHILDNTDPSNPVNLGFISISGVSQITIDEDVLFANFGADLILINITDPLDITVDNIIEDFYDIDAEELSPENYFGSFECPDPSKGFILEWVEETLFDPQCWK